MIPAAYYQNIYLIIVTLMTFYAMSQYNRWGKQIGEKKSTQTIAIILLLFLIWFIGTRPVNYVFVDMVNYSQNYEMLLGERFFFDWNVDNLIWDNFFIWMASKSVSFETWIMVVAIAYFSLMYIACKKLFKGDVLLAFVVYLGAFSTFSYGTNGMKAGVAASLFLVAMAYKDKLWVSVPLAFLAYGIHHSMIMVIAAYLVVLFVKSPKYYFIGWIVCVIIAALHITYFQVLFASLSDETGSGYLMATEETNIVRIGFRPDFILYSAIPIYLGYLMLNKYNYQSATYSFILRLYILTNAIWMLCMYASYSNRIAYLSWFMYPIVLLYPFVSQEKNQMQGKYLRYVVYGHLGFTLFMFLIFYR